MVDLKTFAQKHGLDWDVEVSADQKPLIDSADSEELCCSYPDVSLVLGDGGATPGSGTLHLTTRRVIWIAAQAESSSSGSSEAPAATAAVSSSARSISCTYRQISMHAVSRDSEAYNKPCVYLQLDEGSEIMADADDEEEDEESELTAELRLVPAAEEQVEPIFAQLCECSALNPDTDLEDEAGAQLFFDEAEVMAGLPDDQRAALLAARAEGTLGLTEADTAAELEELVAADPERFEDDEYEDEEEEEEEEEEAAAGATGTAGGPAAANGMAS